MTTKITEKNISQLANTGVNWQSVLVADGSTGLTAVAGRGYFIDTTSGAQTVTLPASPSAGDVVVLKDYARTWGTNNVTIASTLFDGSTNAATFSTSGQTVTLVRMDNTKGWSIVNEDTTTTLAAEFISATGGTIATSGDFKIHSFTGDGCFVVSNGGNAAGSNSVSYLVVAGGGGGGHYGGGGGAGGFRESHSTPVSGCYSASPLATPTGITVTAQTYPVTVGAGGSGAAPGTPRGVSGNNSIFSTITSTGGGGGGSGSASGVTGNTGGSGGGGAPGTVPPDSGALGGAGNTPPVSPPQGQPGGQGWHANNVYQIAGGGGGATVAGSNAPQTGAPATGNVTGGNGATTSISGSPTAYSGGGGGGTDQPVARPGGTGGTGGGGTGGTGPSGGVTGGGTNTGGGGGGGPNVAPGGTGGSGIVIIRYKFQ
jgi:hypothetical protein